MSHEMQQGGPFVTDTDPAGRGFGTRDTRDNTWLSWGHKTREAADRVTTEANAYGKADLR